MKDNLYEKFIELLRAKEELDEEHLLASLSDGCACGLCEAARKALEN